MSWLDTIPWETLTMADIPVEIRATLAVIVTVLGIILVAPMNPFGPPEDW